VSLPESDSRRKNMANHGIPSSWIDSFHLTADCRNLDVDELKQFIDKRAMIKRYGRTLTPGEIGCALSHRNIYHDLVIRDIPLALVIEDDVIPLFDNHFEHVMSAYTYLLKLNPCISPYICHIGVNHDELVTLAKRQIIDTTSRVSRLDSGIRLFRLNTILSSVWCTHAYFISLQAAKQILSNEPLVSFVADDWQERSRLGTLSEIYLTNGLYIQDSRLKGLISHQHAWVSDKQNPLKRIYSKLRMLIIRIIKRIHILTLSRIPIYRGS